MDSRYARLARAVEPDLTGKGRIPFPDELREIVPDEPGPDDEEGAPEIHPGELRHHFLKIGRPRVSAREHLPLSLTPDHGDFTDPHLMDDGDEGLLVVDCQDRDQGLLRGVDGLLDPPQMVISPLLHDGEVVVDSDVQRVMAPEVLRTFDNDAGNPEAVGEVLILDLIDTDAELDVDLLAALRT